MPTKSPGKTKELSQCMPRNYFPFTLSLSKQTNKMILHKQIGLALLQLQHFCTHKSLQNIRGSRERCAKRQIFPLSFTIGFKYSPSTSLCYKRDKREMPDKGPTYILLKVGKLGLSDPLYFTQTYFLSYRVHVTHVKTKLISVSPKKYCSLFNTSYC